MTDRYISVLDVTPSLNGGFNYGRTVWRVPQDFDENEEKLLAEICANGTMSEEEAALCVRLLRK